MSKFSLIPPDGTYSEASATSYGLLGDYIGGVLGTILAFVTFALLLWSHSRSAKIEHRNKVHLIFSEMLSGHEDIINSMHRGDLHGRQVISQSIRDLDEIYSALQEAEWETGIEITTQQRMSMSFIVLMFGIGEQAQDLLSQFPSAVFDVLKRNLNLLKEDGVEIKYHQSIFMHYFRNLYAMHKFVDDSSMSDTDKIELLKVVRAKLSVSEQMILAFNINSPVGNAWIESGLLHKYKPIKNIPKKYFFRDETKLKEVFPYLSFEWEESWNTVSTVKVFKVLGYTVSIHFNTNSKLKSRIISAIIGATFKYLRIFY